MLKFFAFWNGSSIFKYHPNIRLYSKISCISPKHRIMKKIIFFILFVCSTSFIQAQSSQAIGLKLSLLRPSTVFSNYSPEFGASYDFFLNENHGIINELNVNLVTNKILNTNASGDPLFTQKLQSCHTSYSLNYIFKPNQWFIKSGFNVRFADAATYIFIDNELFERSFFNSGNITVFPEYHLGIGRDLDLGKIDNRISAFIDKALNASYLEYGATLGMIYKLKTERE